MMHAQYQLTWDQLAGPDTISIVRNVECAQTHTAALLGIDRRNLIRDKDYELRAEHYWAVMRDEGVLPRKYCGARVVRCP
jgi:hypothetical protein